MSGSLRAVFALVGVLFFTIVGCSVPPLESQFEGGPTAGEIVNHINCELALIVNPNNINTRLYERIALEPTLGWKDGKPSALNSPWSGKLSYLSKYHVVASVLLTLDSLDSQGINPSLNFITPISGSTTFNQTNAIGASLNGTQERNMQLGYSADLAELRDKRGEPASKIARYCSTVPARGVALRGDLGLTDIVVDGLLGLDAANSVNIYGPSGPSLLPVSVSVDKFELTFGPPTPPPPPPPCPTSCPPTSPPPQPDSLGRLTVTDGIIGFTPSSTDATLPGNATFTGTGTADDGTSYFISLTGSALLDSSHPLSAPIMFSVNGTMSRLKGSNGNWVEALGFAPKLNLAGHFTNPNKPTPCSDKRDQRTICVTVEGGSATPENGGKPISVSGAPPVNARAGASTSGASNAAGGTPKTAGVPSSGSTLFGTLVVFTLSYGVNGGPNWTLSRFKGPAGGGGGGGGGSSSGSGGSGGGGQLASLNRTNTDTLTITFVPACKNQTNILRPTNYWDSLPSCNEYAHNIAVNAGAVNNALIQSGRGF